MHPRFELRRSRGRPSLTSPLELQELDGETMSLNEEFLPNIIKQFTGGVMPVAVCTNNTQVPVSPSPSSLAVTEPNPKPCSRTLKAMHMVCPAEVALRNKFSNALFGSYQFTQIMPSGLLARERSPSWHRRPFRGTLNSRSQAADPGAPGLLYVSRWGLIIWAIR